MREWDAVAALSVLWTNSLRTQWYALVARQVNIMQNAYNPFFYTRLVVELYGETPPPHSASIPFRHSLGPASDARTIGRSQGSLLWG